MHACRDMVLAAPHPKPQRSISAHNGDEQPLHPLHPLQARLNSLSTQQLSSIDRHGPDNHQHEVQEASHMRRVQRNTTNTI